MNWKVVRLELAPSGEFPRGSAGRSYLIRLPLTDGGDIDTASLQSQPERATVRRYWPNEADVLGYLEHTPQGYAIRYEKNGGATVNGHYEANGHIGLGLFHFDTETIKVGEQVSLTLPDGRQLHFRVAGVQ
jgi:hypothetical protein